MKEVRRLIFVLVLLFVFVVGKSDFIQAADAGSQVMTSQTQEDLDDQKNRTIESKIYQPQTQSDSSKDNQEAQTQITPNNNNQTKF